MRTAIQLRQCLYPSEDPESAAFALASVRRQSNHEWLDPAAKTLGQFTFSDPFPCTFRLNPLRQSV